MTVGVYLNNYNNDDVVAIIFSYIRRTVCIAFCDISQNAQGTED